DYYCMVYMGNGISVI
nr:immunoglobulin light chain junction region [Macaca mulatta]